jgi:hypothetical protein
MEPATRGPRLPITRTRRLTFGELEPSVRQALCDELYAIYHESSDTLGREEFERLLFREETRVALFHGPRGELAGFSYATLHRIRTEGTEHAVFSAGVLFRLAYRGGLASALFGLTEALRFKLRNPRVPLAYLSVTSTPAPYRLFARTMNRMYPSRKAPPPQELEGVLREVIQHRGLTPVGENPWLVRTLMKPRHTERLRASRNLQDDPDVRFFLEQNPNFAEGHGTALLVWIPLDLANVASGLARAAARQAFASLG